MKNLFLVVTLAFSMNVVAQTQLRIQSDVSLKCKMISLEDDNGRQVSMTDLIVWSDNEISVWLEPGVPYTLIIDQARYTLYPGVPDQNVVYGYICSGPSCTWIDLFLTKAPSLHYLEAYHTSCANSVNN